MAPDPILPDSNFWPTFAWLTLVIVVVAGSIVHAAVRGRWGWVAFLILGTPLAVPLYWITRPHGRVQENS